jgi:hypothetical protein
VIEAQIAFDTSHLDRIQAMYRQAPALVDQAVRKDIVPLARHWVDKHLRTEPGPPVYPIRWTPSKHAEDANKKPNTRWGYYSRQKAAFFATNGFGGGIPYTRQHKLVRGWHVIGDYTGGFGGIRITHDSRIAMFVWGIWQQEYHHITGWPYWIGQLTALSLELDDRLLLAVQRVGDLIAQGGQGNVL